MDPRKILLTFVAMALAFGQADRGAISGVVNDPLGKPMARANVQAKNVATGNIQKAASMADGKYKIGDLPAGEYEVSVFMPGLAGFLRKGVSVQAGQTAALDIRMQEGSQLSTLGEDSAAIAADQKRHAPPSGPTPRTGDGKPDFSGVWWSPTTLDPGKPEWLPFAQKIAKERAENNRKDSPQARCLPSPVLRLGPLYEIVQSKAFMVIISDDDSPGFHQIYLDGRKHPKEPDPLWYGHSIGHWEGDTLVVDRVNFEDGVWLDLEAHPHTDKLHVIERYTRPDAGHLAVEITVEDPGILAKPYTLKRSSDLAPNEEVREFMCTENNRDVEHLVGK